MYVADILEVESLSSKVKDALINSLLTIAYLPEIISSLVQVSPASHKRSLNTCIFILIQTFKIFKPTSSTVDSSLNLLKTLAYCLFSIEEVPKSLNTIICEGILNSKDEKYMSKWPGQSIDSIDTLFKYALNHYSDQKSHFIFVERYLMSA